jgi:arsenite-transporting ATPase
MGGALGMGANQEDMFSKLEGMRTVVQEVNAQFQDPVSLSASMWVVKFQ